MSRWAIRHRIELLALIAWCAASVAVALLSDSTAAFVAIVGSGCGAGVVYQAAQRHWWLASAVLAIGAGGFLPDAVTTGNHSQTEHNVMLAVNLAALAYFMVAVAAENRASARSGAKLSNQLSDDGP